MAHKQYNVWLNEEDVNELDHLRIELKVNRSELIRIFLREGLDNNNNNNKKKKGKIKRNN